MFPEFRLGWLYQELHHKLEEELGKRQPGDSAGKLRLLMGCEQVLLAAAKKQQQVTFCRRVRCPVYSPSEG